MGISPIQLLIVLAIVVLVFGGKRLRSLGSDLGHAIKGFKDVTKDDKADNESTPAQERIDYEAKHTDSRVIDAEVSKEQDKTH